MSMSTSWTTLQFVRPEGCGRCDGSGFVSYGNVEHLGAMRTCFECGGCGTVETDPAAIEARKEAARQERRQERRMEKLRAWEATQRGADGSPTAAQYGLWTLQNTGQWDRWNAAVDAIVEGMGRYGDLAGIEAQLAVVNPYPA